MSLKNLSDICDDVMIYVICSMIDDKILVDYILYLIDCGDLTDDANIKFERIDLKPIYRNIFKTNFLKHMYDMIECVIKGDLAYLKINMGEYIDMDEYKILVRRDPHIYIYMNLFRIYKNEINDMIKNDFIVNTKRIVKCDKVFHEGINYVNPGIYRSLFSGYMAH